MLVLEATFFLVLPVMGLTTANLVLMATGGAIWRLRRKEVVFRNSFGMGGSARAVSLAGSITAFLAVVVLIFLYFTSDFHQLLCE